MLKHRAWKQKKINQSVHSKQNRYFNVSVRTFHMYYYCSARFCFFAYNNNKYSISLTQKQEMKKHTEKLVY